MSYKMQKSWICFIFTVGYLLLATGYIFSAPAKSVILLIGDGMGPAIIGISKYYNDMVLKKAPLNIERVMNEGVTGWMTTHSASHLVTDSAAGATAFACGVKTYNEAVGVDEKGNSVETILEKAKKKGKRVGVVTTTDLADATPGSFYAHVARRAQKQEIAKQGIAQGKVDLLLGGGASSFDAELARQNGYKIITSKKELDQILKKGAGSNELLLGLFYEKELPYRDERSAEIPSLTEMAKLAVETLGKNENGFFLMIEGGRIDHAAHANQAEKMVKEFLEFDEVIGLALEYQKKNPDTLLLLTADHDTGGSALSKIEKENYTKVDDLAKFEKIYWISHNHTACPVLLAGKGPGADKVNGLRDNTEVYKIMKESLGLQ